MKRFLLAAVVAAFGGALAAKPPGEPTNPNGVGKEATPVEREFHAPPPAEAPFTQGRPPRARRAFESDVWAVVKALLGVR